MNKLLQPCWATRLKRQVRQTHAQGFDRKLTLPDQSHGDGDQQSRCEGVDGHLVVVEEGKQQSFAGPGVVKIVIAVQSSTASAFKSKTVVKIRWLKEYALVTAGGYAFSHGLSLQLALESSPGAKAPSSGQTCNSIYESNVYRHLQVSRSPCILASASFPPPPVGFSLSCNAVNGCSSSRRARSRAV